MKKLHINAKKIDKFLLKFLKKQKKSLLVAPMKYGLISGNLKLNEILSFLFEWYNNIKSPKEYIAICKLTNSLKLIIDCDNSKMVIAVNNLFDTPLTIFDITVSYLALR